MREVQQKGDEEGKQGESDRGDHRLVEEKVAKRAEEKQLVVVVRYDVHVHPPEERHVLEGDGDAPSRELACFAQHYPVNPANERGVKVKLNEQGSGMGCDGDAARNREQPMKLECCCAGWESGAVGKGGDGCAMTVVAVQISFEGTPCCAVHTV